MLLPIVLAMPVLTWAQHKKMTLHVSGNCDMCAKNIETAAKKAGATTAKWNKEKKVLKFSFDNSVTNADSIEHSIAHAGYDTEHFAGDIDAYNKLHECCKYDNKKQ